jgi:tetratricopeptide (TPR) repeat protein
MASLWFLGFILFGAWPLGAVTSDEYLKAGQSLYLKKQYDQAVQYLKAAVQVDPNNWQAYATLGNSLYQQGKLSEALEAFDQCLALRSPNPDVQAFDDALRKKLGTSPQSTAPIPPPMPGVPSQGSVSPDNYAAAIEEADGKLRYYGMSPKDHPLLEQYYAGKALENRGRASLRLEDQSKLDTDEKWVELYGGVKSDFYDPHFTLMLGILTPTIVSLDLGYYLNPTTNVGLEWGYFPVAGDDYQQYDSTTGQYTWVYQTGALICLEPRIKYYSSPSGLSTYYGFSALYYALHQPTAAYNYQTNFDLFAVGYLFGFRTLPMDGMTMEIGWKMGVAVIMVTNSDYTETYVNGEYQESYSPTTSTVPFPYIIPEFRFGFTF